MNTEIQHAHALEFLNSFDSKPLIYGKYCLDLGCGDGFGAVELMKRGAKKVAAIDPHPDPSYSTNGAPNLILKFSMQFASSLHDMVDARWDLIWCHHVLEHVPNPVMFLEEACGKMKQDGWLMLAVPNMATTTNYSPGHLHNFMAPNLADCLRVAGFETKAVWANGGQLRVRAVKNKKAEWPEPMKQSIAGTGRCPAEVLEKWNW